MTGEHPVRQRSVVPLRLQLFNNQTRASMTKIIHVAAGVIHNTKGQIFIAKRPDNAHQGGLWEFPGGKLEAGESVQTALIRELQEELGITATEFSPLIQIRHDYPDKSVLLDVWNITGFEGGAHGREGQPTLWVEPSRLDEFEFPAANGPIVTAARLPGQWAITANVSTVSDCLNGLSAVLDQGIRLVQLRQKSWTAAQWLEALPEAASLCKNTGVTLMLNSSGLQALGNAAIENLQTHADGLHLTSTDLANPNSSWITAAREAKLWLSASCHSAEELQQAENLGADFVTLSPVQVTASHPQQTPLGWAQFAELVATAKIPVFALGGVTVADVDQAVSHGAQGVAGIRGWWA
jgi:8-oxo-dGTP diphosphatase